MKMSGIQKLADFPLQNYSLDSLNEFLKMENVSKDKLAENHSSQFEASDLDKDMIVQSAYSFSKKETK